MPSFPYIFQRSHTGLESHVLTKWWQIFPLNVFLSDTVYPLTHLKLVDRESFRLITLVIFIHIYKVTSCKISEITQTADKCKVMLSPMKHQDFLSLNSLSLWTQIHACLTRFMIKQQLRFSPLLIFFVLSAGHQQSSDTPLKLELFQFKTN